MIGFIRFTRSLQTLGIVYILIDRTFTSSDELNKGLTIDPYILKNILLKEYRHNICFLILISSSINHKLVSTIFKQFLFHLPVFIFKCPVSTTPISFYHIYFIWLFYHLSFSNQSYWIHLRVYSFTMPFQPIIFYSIL